MKKIFYTIGFALLAAASLVSCSKGEYNSGDNQTGRNPFSDENNKPKVVPTGTFTAKVNGSDFSATYANGYYMTFAGVENWVMVGFKTNFSAADGFIIKLEKKEKGVYNLSLSGTNTVAYTPTGSTATVLAESGQVEITEVTDTRVKGKFNMTGGGGLNVSDGNFDLPIIKYSDYYQVN